MTIGDAIGGVLVVGGTVFLLLAAIGVVRLPDVFARQHAAGKAATLGLGLTFAGVGTLLGDATSAVKLVMAVAFLFVSAPVATHALARAAYRDGVPMWDATARDDLADAPEVDHREDPDPGR